MSEQSKSRTMQRDRAQERIPMGANVTGAGETSKDTNAENNPEDPAGSRLKIDKKKSEDEAVYSPDADAHT